MSTRLVTAYKARRETLTSAGPSEFWFSSLKLCPQGLVMVTMILLGVLFEVVGVIFVGLGVVSFESPEPE